ncbi:hypothetical protein CEXT_192621 [Caerostris extrusa]|uniref:Uncharacterized protein n=1 Tax=Caerostris extrusa TaxID=172846 RepID=A0AAV4V444_CAEEX|nr:hypothetical protein CEXT_192621 [Caerostris extrusa]
MPLKQNSSIVNDSLRSLNGLKKVIFDHVVLNNTSHFHQQLPPIPIVFKAGDTNIPAVHLEETNTSPQSHSKTISDNGFSFQMVGEMAGELGYTNPILSTTEEDRALFDQQTLHEKSYYKPRSVPSQVFQLRIINLPNIRWEEILPTSFPLGETRANTAVEELGCPSHSISTKSLYKKHKLRSRQGISDQLRSDSSSTTPNTIFVRHSVYRKQADYSQGTPTSFPRTVLDRVIKEMWLFRQRQDLLLEHFSSLWDHKFLLHVIRNARLITGNENRFVRSIFGVRDGGKGANEVHGNNMFSFILELRRCDKSLKLSR